ncbi:hypothetical protein, conserved [Babesia ovata]|uniref:Extracellular matrix-binding ebh n=1 Tax=Babesia ovata TaxID=189622 RepID=A0A2H6KK24_9APIC|nr:uncharacterized protein BOVATA_048370 [Babesia ovata]GBE63344.1 hypothetical protein, conserved [Babesia ovata]
MRDEEKLDKLLKELYDSIGKGSGVLADQVGKVSAWLGRYESEVNKKCEDVKTPVREMKTLINHDKTLIEEEQHNALKKQVGDWTHRAKLYIEKAEKAKNALDHLDPTLSGILVKNELQIAFGEVRAGINALEKRYGGEIAGPVGSLKSYSESFEKRFRTTHTALQNAIKAVETDIGNLNELEKVEQIMEGANSYVQVPLLQAMQKGTAFSELKTYFRNLDSQVMKHVMEAMEAIAKGSTYLYPTDLNEVKAPLTKVRGILDGTSAVPNFQEIIAQLKEYGVKTDDVDDLKTKLPKLSGTVQIAIEKVERSETPQKQETSSLFTALAQIVDAVSQHSNDIVTALVKAINDKVKEEVTAVVKVIKANVTKIKNGIENTVDDRHDYGGGSPGVGQPAPGLQKLVSEFKSQINQELTTLQGNVGKEADRKEGDSIYSNLLKVKADVTDLGTKVANVVDHVDKVSTDLAACILDAEMLIANASQMTEKAIVQLRDAANIKIQQAFTSLQSKAKSLYTERKTKEVEALQKIVEKEFTAIDSIIKHDKQRGLKGLLTKLQMSLDAHLQEFGTKSQKPHTVSQFAEIVREFSHVLFYGLYDQHDFTPLESNFHPYVEHLQNLLIQLETSKHFHHEVTKKREALQDALSSFHPENMGDASKRLLSPLKSGMIKFTTELSHAYVNKYSGSKPVEQWEEDETIKVGDKTETKKVLSTEGRNCAKVCLTLMEGLRKDLFDLQNECKSGGKNKWNEKKICLTEMVKTEKVENKLGQWFQNRGFTVPNDDKTQNGELNNERKGENIFGKITENIAAAHSIPVLKTWKDMCVEEQKKKFSISNQKGTATISINTDNIHLFDLADFLRDFFRKYYHVCQHIHIDSPKAPSNIYQMLQWLSGLYFNPMYDKLGEYFKELFDKPKGEEAKPYKDFKDTDLILDATSTIRPKELNHRLQQTCLHSQLVLVAFLGNGYADGRYACEFRTNFDKLLYPSNPSACFDMLVDVLNRVFHQLRFLFIQCSNSRSRVVGRTANMAGMSAGRRGPAISSNVPTKTVNKSTTKHVTEVVTK